MRHGVRSAIALTGWIWITSSCAAGHSRQPTLNSQGERPTLAPTATFHDLVVAIRSAEAPSTSTKTKGCLLGQDPTGFRLEAKVKSPIDPIPPPPPELDSALQRTQRARILAQEGFFGTPSAEKIGLAALTPTSFAASLAVGVVLTDQGIYVRPTDFDYKEIYEGDSPFTAVKEVDLPHILQKLPSHKALLHIYLSAEADVPLTRVYQTMSILDDYGTVAFAVAVRFPSDDAAADRGVCPVEPAPDARHAQASPAMEERGRVLASALSECFAGVDSQVQGRMIVDVELREDGSIKTACIREDQVGSTRLSACALSAVAVEPPKGPETGNARMQRFPLINTPLRRVHEPIAAACE